MGGESFVEGEGRKRTPLAASCDLNEKGLKCSMVIKREGKEVKRALQGGKCDPANRRGWQQGFARDRRTEERGTDLKREGELPSCRTESKR